MRGPLTILCEMWINGKPELPDPGKNVISYLQELRQTLQLASDIAQNNAAIQQENIKYYYDKQSTDRHFVAGQKALLLMPSSPYKMEAT
jgi:hypothetical protein